MTKEEKREIIEELKDYINKTIEDKFKEDIERLNNMHKGILSERMDFNKILDEKRAEMEKLGLAKHIIINEMRMEKKNMLWRLRKLRRNLVAI